MPVYNFDRQCLYATPWKNGGGVTQEIACQPVGSDMAAFDWRVSIAHIAADGPFSLFEGVDRVITLLEGAGVCLHSPDGTLDHCLDTPLAPFAFAGETPIDATLIGGACHDLNVMTCRSRCRAHVAVCHTDTELQTTSAGVLLVLCGHWRVGIHTLAPGQGLWWHDEDQTWSLHCDDPRAALVAVSIFPLMP